jgi:nitrogen regulatory protein P-II 1
MIKIDFKQLKKYKIIVTIVKKGLGSKVVTASKKMGAQGGTILFGRGTADRKIYENLLGIDFEPEKEIVLSLVSEDYTDHVLDQIIKETKLKKTGKGIAFVLDVNKYIGIAHLLELKK